ncbi:MAG: PLDc N-terminal domain-containing protein [Candidatus Hinthialibacter sp.]
MDVWVILTYSLFIASILLGWISCWRSELPAAQKIFWSILILVFPIAGTLIYFLTASESRELFQ